MRSWLCERHCGLTSYTEMVKKGAHGYWVLRHMAMGRRGEQHFSTTVRSSRSGTKFWMCLHGFRGALSEGKGR